MTSSNDELCASSALPPLTDWSAVVVSERRQRVGRLHPHAALQVSVLQRLTQQLQRPWLCFGVPQLRDGLHSGN